MVGKSHHKSQFSASEISEYQKVLRNDHIIWLWANCDILLWVFQRNLDYDGHLHLVPHIIGTDEFARDAQCGLAGCYMHSLVVLSVQSVTILSKSGAAKMDNLRECCS